MEGAVHSLQVQKIHIFFNSCVSTLVFQFVKLREGEEGTSLCCLWQTLIGWNEADPMLSKKNFFNKFFWYQKRERKCIYYLPSLISILHSLVWLPRGEDKSIFINLPNHLAFLAPLLLLLCYNHSVWKLPQKFSSLRAKRATLISQKTLGYTFLPLKNSFEFLVILFIL